VSLRIAKRTAETNNNPETLPCGGQNQRHRKVNGENSDFFSKLFSRAAQAPKDRGGLLAPDAWFS
jgi:hypothetical protein